MIYFRTLLLFSTCLYVLKVQSQTYDIYNIMNGYFPLNNPGTLNNNLAKNSVSHRLSNWELVSASSISVSGTPNTFLNFISDTYGSITVQQKGVTFCTWFTFTSELQYISNFFTLEYFIPNLYYAYYWGSTINTQKKLLFFFLGQYTFKTEFNSVKTHLCFTASKKSSILYINSVLVWEQPNYEGALGNAENFLFIPSESNIFFSGITVFSRKLCASEIAHVYNNFNTIYAGNFNLPLSLTCPTMYSCSDDTWRCISEPECNICTNNYYRTHSSIEQFCTSYPDSSYVSICDQCILPGQCTAGFYMDYVCNGTQTEKNKCLTCDASPCPLHKYRYQCTGTQNSLCGLTYTQCPTGYYLAGYGTYNDGTCQSCRTCGGGSGDVIIPCSRYEDATCAETCVLGSLCSLTSNSVCLFDNFLSILVCLTCPLGYKAKNNLCVPCPRGTICDVSGNPQCNGLCSFPDVPSCTTSVSDGFTCTQGMCPVEQYTTDPHALYQHNYIQGRCDTQQRCVDGYYLLMKAGELTPTCTACNNVLGAGYRPVTPGLFINDPDSCVFEMIPGTTSLNEKGYYSNDNMMCPSGYTSLPGYAGTISDCKPCPGVSNLYMIQTQTWLCEWQCIDGYVQRGDMCMSPSNIYKCYGEGYSINTFVSKCIIQPIPWQKQGFEYTNTYSFQITSTNPAFTGIDHVKYNPLQIYYTNIRLDLFYKISAYSKPYYSLNVGNYINIDPPNENVIVPGQICSLTPDGYDNYYVVYCNVSMIFFFNYQLKRNIRVIGNSTSGYQEGMRDEALFSYEMYVSMYSTNSNSEINLIVIDTWNCVIRQVVIGSNGPGDFRTTSYKLAGNVVNNFPLCDNELNKPRYLFPLISLLQPTLIAFVNYNNVLCQFHTQQRQVVCLPNIILDTTNLRSISSSLDGLSLLIEYTDGYMYLYTHTGTKCPDDYTSLKGSDCSIYRPFKGGVINEGYYIDDDGVAHECIPAVCAIGQYSSNCMRNGPASCLPCVTDTSATIQYISSGSCEYHIIQPCPMNMYFDAGVGYCVFCPGVMYTLATNGLSFSDCYCPSPLSKKGSECFNVNSMYIFSVLAETSCDVYQYWDSNTGTCISCALNPTIGNTQCAAPASATIPQWLLDRPSIRCDAGSQLVNVSDVLPVCEKCPSHLVGLDRLSCTRCPGYRKPYWDASICVCKHPTVQNVDGSCICDKGYELGVNGCVLCLNNTYSDVALTLTDQFWTQSKTCSSCPLGTYSYMGQTTCTACPQYQYRTANDARCMDCASGFYSTNAQVSTCTACATSCSIGYYSVPCPTDPTKYICFACKPLPSNAQWLAMTAYATSYQCIWKCNSGYYRGIDQCNLCSTDYDCVPGKQIEPCSEISDLACTQDCFNDTKPVFNSVWDHGCNWKCSDGYMLLTTDYGMWKEYDCIIPESYVPPTR